MKKRCGFGLLLAAGLAALIVFGLPLAGQGDGCVSCHLELDDSLKAPAESYGRDIHRNFGLNCTDCHGGNASQEDMESAKDRTFKGAPARKEIPDFCGGCHADIKTIRRFNPSLRVDQLDLYWTSEHGQLLRQGDARGAVCTDCHGAHGIQPGPIPSSATFPWNIPSTCGRCHSHQEKMPPSVLSTNQEDEYRGSVHARALFEKKDLSAPTCNDCHGNHGATPPEVASIAFVCRQCHASTGELFSRSPHKKAYDELGISECEACHGHHRILAPSDGMLGTGEEAVCAGCHEAGTKPYETAGAMKSLLENFKARLEKAQVLLSRGERKGVEVSEPRFKLQEATTALILLRNLTHSLSLEEMSEKAGEGDRVLDEVLLAGEEALGEAKFRRTGLVVATAFLFLLAVALFLKVRQIGKRAA